ncbi:MAG TPA: hypothetical protein VND96_15165 [Candidatus Micrarchaeaceae archaeon]|nr:hypothetical protein [Candidatus Micrarchaeaceae archaeon]
MPQVAVLDGNVTLARIAIENGATLNGPVTMGGEVGSVELAESDLASGQS